MTVEEFFNRINEIAASSYEATTFGNQEWKEALKLANAKIAAESDFINDATADWTVDEWIKLFECQINHGDPEIYAIVAEKITDLTDGEFFKSKIKENTDVLKQNVYICADRDILYKSDILHGAVKALNAISSGTANDEVLEAFQVCASENEHILYDLAEYVAMQCTDKISELISDEAVEGDKLIALVSMYVQSGKRNDDVFKAMKQRFKKLPDDSEVKDVFAAVFGDYGDSNAIVILRKFAKSLISVYNETRDRELFSRIMMVISVIEGLGGITDDLMQ